MRSTPTTGSGVIRPGVALSVAALLFAVGLLGSGCSTEEPLPPRDGDRDATSQSRRIGSLLAEFERAPGEGQRRVRIHAQFLDIQGVDVDRALGALEVWSVDPELEPDACTLRSSVTPPSGADREMNLDLLSVGSIEVDGPERRLMLEARRLPDLLNSFSGVIYGTGDSFGGPEREPLPFEPGAEYTFRAEGDGATGGFDATLQAPRPIEIRSRSGEPTDEDSTLVLREKNPFRFGWSSPDGARGAVYFDVSTGHEPNHPHLKCRLEDDGSFTVPADLVEQLADASSTLRVTLRRVTSRDVDIAGLQESQFALSTVDRLTLRID